MKRLVKWGPLAALLAWLAREATHVHAHVLAPQTLLLCAIPPLACVCWYCFRRKKGRRK